MTWAGTRSSSARSGTWFDFDRQYIPGALGSYRFRELATSWSGNRPDRYEITMPLTEDGSNPRLSA